MSPHVAIRYKTLHLGMRALWSLITSQSLLLNQAEPGNDITTLLKHFCMGLRDFTHILDENDSWTGKWSIIAHLPKDSTSQDWVQHLPQTFFLVNSSGLIFYPYMPQICK